MLKVGTTFSGIGAPEQALKNLNIEHEVLWACDIDKHAKKTYLANHKCKIWYDDITKIDINNLEYVDLYILGFPCTDLSTAGKMDLTKNRSSLVSYSLDIIDKILPKYILFENVKGLLSPKFKLFFDNIIKRLSKNYNIKYQILNSKNFEVPQNRERIYCIGIRKNINQEFNFNTGEVTNKVLFNILDNNCNYYKILKNSYLIINNISKNNIHKYAIFNDTQKRLTAIKNKTLQQTQNIYGINGICPTIDAQPHLPRIFDNKNIRELTLLEKIRLQGFPEDFIFTVSDRQAKKQLGNSITINVLESIFKNLLINKNN